MVEMEKLVSLAKRRGFVFPGSEIYGGLANSWDYGPLGVEMKNNIARACWKAFVQERDDMVGLDSSIIMNPRVWEASGHVQNFNDPLVDCRACKTRHRGDKLLEQAIGVEKTAAVPFEEVGQKLNQLAVPCPECGKSDWTDARRFNLLFETQIGVLADAKNKAYLRGETAQGIFINFKNILNASRKKLPFGIAQVGKVFRNEITPGQFIFRTREFEQFEIEYFIRPPKSEEEWRATFESWKGEIKGFFSEVLGLSESKLRWRRHADDERSFYSKDTYDVEYDFPTIGWGEIHGFAYRTDYDLKQHIEHSGADLSYTDDDGSHFVPHCIEPSFGLTRTFLAVLAEAYAEEELEPGDVRTVLRLKPVLAPFKVAVLPLSKKEELSAPARALAARLRKRWTADYDETQSIGKRYRRQDEIGTPYCVTVDFETLQDKAVTVRDRDSMKQERVPIADVETYLSSHLGC